MNPNSFGIEGSGSEASMTAMKYSFVSVGIWWAFLVNILSIFYQK